MNGSGRPPEIPNAPWWMLPALGSMAMLIFAGALVASCFLDNDTLRTQMFTAAAAAIGTTLGFFFGSSSGSQKKDDTIAAQGAALNTGAPAATVTKTVLDPGPPATATATTTPAPEAHKCQGKRK